jgi:hypothetical protein
MTGTRERPPLATAPAAAIAATQPGRVVGLDGIRGLAGAGGALAGRAAHEIKLVGDVDQLARS